jgi:cyanophycinase-like exopeptidase
MRTYFALLLLLANSPAFGQTDFTYWLTGDSTDVATNHQPGIVLAGGATDNDDAMQWMLDRADGGDVVVLRASGSDGYNDYFFSDLGVNVHSVETIRFDGPAAANDPFVINRIRNAEVLFFAGGDQYDYYTYWKDTPIEDAIHYVVNEKQATIGGTSAGMAILGGAYYAPSDLGVFSSEALSDPFHPYMDTIGHGDFLNLPFLADVITDTHYEDRERQGRHFTFLARLAGMLQARSYGIASNDYVAVTIDENGIARVFGEYPEFGDYAYFLQANCQPDFLPELMEPGTPLTWNRGESAVKVYKVPGNTAGEYTFDLNDWVTGNGGTWENWYVQEGVLGVIEGVDSDCADVVSSATVAGGQQPFRIFPNPTSDQLFINNKQLVNIEGLYVQDSFGRTLLALGADATSIAVHSLPAGMYLLVIQTKTGTSWHRFQKVD